MKTVLTELAAILAATPRRLVDISDYDAEQKPDPSRWSKKEILGHLIDSVANNHQRVVRSQAARSTEFPAYPQEAWVKAQAYNLAAWPDLVNLWLLYNRHLLHVLRNLPEPVLLHEVAIGGKPPITVQAMAEGYVDHLKNHLAQILPS
jgi:hypothetical protein